jgi:TetR/AcrR family transcriptional regulator
MASHSKGSSRQAIIDASFAIIAKNKISGTNLRQIAGQAGISLGTLHYYFPSKAELLLALLDYMRDLFHEGQQGIMKQHLSPPEKLNHFLNQEKRYLMEKSLMLEVFFDFWSQGLQDPEIQSRIQFIYDKWREDIAAVVAEGVQSGDFASEIAPMIPTLMVSIMEGAALQYLIDNDLYDLETYFSTSYKMIMGLIGVGQNAVID